MEKQVVKIKEGQTTLRVGDKLMIFEEATIAPNDRVAIIPDNPEEITAGGLIIPDTAKGKVTAGTVHSIGIGVADSSIQVGSKVLYTKYAGQDVTHNGVTYVVMREHEIQLVLNKLVGHIEIEENKELEIEKTKYKSTMSL